jgi:hypothetical protein
MTPGQPSPSIEDLLSGRIRGHFQDEEVLLQRVLISIARGSSMTLEKLRRNPVPQSSLAHPVLPPERPERGFQ